MDAKTLKSKQADLEATFNTLQTEKQEHTTRIGEIDTELLKLQGEYRLTQELIDGLKKGKKDE